MSKLPTRIVKVGGSLFDLPDLDSRLSIWLENQVPACNILIAGGGKLVDEVRTLPLDERTAHWQCIDLLTKTANNLAEVMSGVEIVDYLSEFGCSSSSDVVFSPARWLREVEPNLPGTRLRESWDVTSDSIAARVAICLNAVELVLLKSADAPNGDYSSLAQCKYVDCMYPELVEEVRHVRMVNLRQIPCDALRRG